MSMKSVAVALCRSALVEGRTTLLEPDLYDLLSVGGVETPRYYTIIPGQEDGPLPGEIPGDRVVVKVVSPAITHKTEMGGVMVVMNRPDEIRSAVRKLIANVTERGGAELAATVRRILVSEFVVAPTDLAGQLFMGMRFSPDMGPVLAMGFGGLETEEMAVRFKPGQGMVLASPVLSSPEQILTKFKKSFVYRKIAGLTRGGERRVGDDEILKVLAFFKALAVEVSGLDDTGLTVFDFEVNPFFVANGKLVAVDAFMRFGAGVSRERTAPLDQIHTLLHPKTAAIMGVSNKINNPGRVILNNLLREKFDVENLRIVRPDRESVDGVQAVASIADLPWRADLIVVAVGADQVPGIIEETIEHEKAVSMVLIPGGMGETEDGKVVESRIKARISEARLAGRLAPVLVGPNCLGIKSLPGRYDTLFIPESKLPLPEGGQSNAALVCQSGAFMITRMNNTPFLSPTYAISSGNQMDLALVDFVDEILREGVVDVFGLYIEGFDTLDGLRLARLIAKGRADGRDFIVYKAGRTSEGQTATSSHTASISGDYDSCVETLRDAGALVTADLEDFNTLMTLATTIRHKEFTGRRLGCVSNAGYETVGMADNISQEPKFQLASYSPETARKITERLALHKLSALVNLRNPLDITPMGSDNAYVDMAEAMVDDDGIDAVVVGVIPLTPAMKTLPDGVDPRGIDTVLADSALPALLPPLVERSRKPVIVTVDSGQLYDALVRELASRGVPVFHAVDRAMQALQKYMEHRLGS